MEGSDRLSTRDREERGYTPQEEKNRTKGSLHLSHSFLLPPYSSSSSCSSPSSSSTSSMLHQYGVHTPENSIPLSSASNPKLLSYLVNPPASSLLPSPPSPHAISPHLLLKGLGQMMRLHNRSFSSSSSPFSPSSSLSSSSLASSAPSTIETSQPPPHPTAALIPASLFPSLQTQASPSIPSSSLSLRHPEKEMTNKKTNEKSLMISPTVSRSSTLPSPKQEGSSFLTSHADIRRKNPTHENEGISTPASTTTSSSSQGGSASSTKKEGSREAHNSLFQQSLLISPPSTGTPLSVNREESNLSSCSSSSSLPSSSLPQQSVSTGIRHSHPVLSPKHLRQSLLSSALLTSSSSSLLSPSSSPSNALLPPSSSSSSASGSSTAVTSPNISRVPPSSLGSVPASSSSFVVQGGRCMKSQVLISSERSNGDSKNVSSPRNKSSSLQPSLSSPPVQSVHSMNPSVGNLPSTISSSSLSSPMPSKTESPASSNTSLPTSSSPSPSPLAPSDPSLLQIHNRKPHRSADSSSSSSTASTSSVSPSPLTTTTSSISTSPS
ncbi:hypothetical protein CSUI_008572, partial [Cystoisospora suis]